jgi:hypothetical protein
MTVFCPICGEMWRIERLFSDPERLGKFKKLGCGMFGVPHLDPPDLIAAAKSSDFWKEDEEK